MVVSQHCDTNSYVFTLVIERSIFEILAPIHIGKNMICFLASDDTSISVQITAGKNENFGGM